MNLEPRESIFYRSEPCSFVCCTPPTQHVLLRTSREGLGWKPGGRFDFHPTSQNRIKEMQVISAQVQAAARILNIAYAPSHSQFSRGGPMSHGGCSAAVRGGGQMGARLGRPRHRASAAGLDWAPRRARLRVPPGVAVGVLGDARDAVRRHGGIPPLRPVKRLLPDVGGLFARGEHPSHDPSRALSARAISSATTSQGGLVDHLAAPRGGWVS